MTTPANRRAIAKIAANARWARETNRSLATAKARAKGPGSLVYWIARVDPDGQMSQTDAVRPPRTPRPPSACLSPPA